MSSPHTERRTRSASARALASLDLRLLLAARTRWHEPARARATGVVALTYLLNTAAKLVVGRARPSLAGLPALSTAPTQLSFPSAHASTSFAGALAYSRLGAPASALYALAGGLSLSRLYLGMHYPSDVLAGALLGSALAASLTRGSAR